MHIWIEKREQDPKKTDYSNPIEQNVIFVNLLIKLLEGDMETELIT